MLPHTTLANSRSTPLCIHVGTATVLPLASESWEAFLDAPVPFLAGVPRGHSVTRKIGASEEAESELGPHDHLYVVDIDDDVVRMAHCEGGEPPLPGMDGLAAALKPLVDRLNSVDIVGARLGTAGPEVGALVADTVEQIFALFTKWHAALLRQLQTNCNVRTLYISLRSAAVLYECCSTQQSSRAMPSWLWSVAHNMRCVVCMHVAVWHGMVTQVANPFDVDECVGEFTGRHADFLNAFSRTQMFAVYAEQHSMPEPEPEPEPEPAVTAFGTADRRTSSSDDGEDKL